MIRSVQKSSRLIHGVFLVVAAVMPVVPLQVSADDSPRLILQITVDQLRGDLPNRYYERFGKGGFKYLWEHGVVYTDAYHNHANNETIVGHTSSPSIQTGSVLCCPAVKVVTITSSKESAKASMPPANSAVAMLGSTT